MSYSSTLETLKISGNFRSIPDTPHRTDILDLSTNDYLGLATRPDLRKTFFDNPRHRSMSMTSSAARLLASDQEEYSHLEQYLSDLYCSRPALLFNSGYHANTGLISALASEPGTIIIADKLAHASIIDGIILSKAPFQRFVHNDFTRLEKILAKEHDRYERLIVVTESVYSMDGDRTDIDALIELKRRYPKVMLYVDEAHAVGVLGANGLGLCHSHPAFNEIDIIIGTFGKALASMGAFCITTRELRDYAINRSRSFIFSTALPPLNCAWTRFMISTAIGMDKERKHLTEMSHELANTLSSLGFPPPEAGHIQPIITGSSSTAIQLSQKLSDLGFKILPIRTPTVPPGTERLRISLNAAITKDQMERFTQSLRDIL